jgi:uncharacterized protein (TIGR04255 family)
MPRSYPNPPILEAVVEFRFTAAAAKVVEQSLRERLGGIYEHIDAQDFVEAQVAFDKNSVSTSTRRVHHRTVMASSLRTRMLSCADDALGIHVLRPYPGWDNFLDQISEAIEALPESVRRGLVESIALRYLNQFALPGNSFAYEDFLKIVPPRAGNDMPTELLDHQSTTRAFDPQTKTTVELRSGILSTPPTVGLDILVHRKLDRPFCEWRGELEGIHARERQIFEDCITDRAREIFQ